MSVMTRGIITQPYSLAMHSDYSRRQFYSHAQVLLADHDSARKHWENESNNVQALMDEVARLKAEIAGIKTGYEAYEQVVQGLKAENEALRKDSAVLEPVFGDQLPAIGSTVLIHLGRSDAWVEHTVAGYYAWNDLGRNQSLHRIFVRVRDADGYLNARLLKDVRIEDAMSKEPSHG